MDEHQASTATAPIRLHFDDAHTPVLVTAEDEDRFMTTAAEAAQACKQAQSMLQWKQEFDGLLSRVHGWCREQERRVSHAYTSFSHDGLKVFILVQGAEYAFELDDPITDLDIELAGAYPRCPTEVMQLPAAPVETLTSFFDPGKALQVYGK